MTIALPGASKGPLSGLFGKKKKRDDEHTTVRAKKPLEGHQIAKLFTQDAKLAAKARPAKLNESEKQDRDRLNSLRGALYSKD